MNLCARNLVVGLVAATGWASGLNSAEQAFSTLEKYRAADALNRKELQPQVLKVLRSYEKKWQGNAQRQKVFEATFLDLASVVAEDMEGDQENKLCQEVASRAALRLKYLSSKTALSEELRRMQILYTGRRFEECKILSEKIIAGHYGFLPGVELVLGLCHFALGDWKLSLAKFRNVIVRSDKDHEAFEAAAAYMAGHVLLQLESYDDASKVFVAVQGVYPRSAYAPQAKIVASRLRQALGKRSKRTN